MIRLNHLTVVATVLGLLACGPDRYDHRTSNQQTIASETDTSNAAEHSELEALPELELSSSVSTNISSTSSQDAQVALQQIEKNVFKKMKGGKAPRKSVDALQSQAVSLINKQVAKLGGKRVPGVASSGLALRGTTTSQQITPEMICSAIYPSNSSQFSMCVSNLTASIGSGIFDWTFDPVAPAVRVSTFPLTIPGVGSGMCVYARVSVLALGIACANASGGVWAGCDVWNGCGSGGF